MMDLKTAGIFILLCVPFLVMTIWAVVSAAEKEFKTLGHKVIWLMVAAIPFVGFLIYFPFGARQGKKPQA